MLLHLVRKLGKVPPPLSSNFFEIFSLTPTFNVDLTELSRVYKRLQAEFHPDKHINSSALEQKHAEQNSALVNKAYACLKDPYSRARLLLRFRECNPDVRTMDMEFLSDMMEYNDQIEMCDDIETLNELKRHNEEAISVLYVQFELFFGEQELKTAAERLAKVKFLLKTRGRIEQQAEFLGVEIDMKE